MKADKQRIADLEAAVRGLQRNTALKPVRDSKPTPDKRAWWLAVLNSSLAFGNTTTAELVTRDGDQFVRSGHTVTVEDFWLNSDEEEIPQGTLLVVGWYINCWVPLSIYCVENDWLDS